MDMLKKYFPYSFKEKKDVAALVINIIIHIVVGAIVGVGCSTTSFTIKSTVLSFTVSVLCHLPSRYTCCLNITRKV